MSQISIELELEDEADLKLAEEAGIPSTSEIK